MQSKISLRRLLILSTVGISLFPIIFFLTPNLPAQGSPIGITLSLPVRLKIPSIHVNTALEYVGLAPDGSIGVPKNPINAAWFDAGPRPGDIGSSIIDGHYGWLNNTPAVFDNLNKIQKGDKLYVENKQGVTTVFVVNEIRIYGEQEDARSVLISNDGKAHLNLITCNGIWNETTQSYSDRLVIFSDME